MAADAVEDLDRARLALLREPDEPVRVDGRPECLLRELGRGEAGHVWLEVPAPGARPLARESVVHDHHVAELGPAAVELAVDDGATAAPGAEREHHHRLHVARRAEVELGVRGRVGVVLDADR